MNEFIEEKLPDVQHFLYQLTVCPETIIEEPSKVNKASKDASVKAMYSHLIKSFPKFLKVVLQHNFIISQANVGQKKFYSPLITILKEDISPEQLKQAEQLLTSNQTESLKSEVTQGSDTGSSYVNLDSSTSSEVSVTTPTATDQIEIAPLVNETADKTGENKSAS